MDEIARDLPGELLDQGDKAGIGVAAFGDTRKGFVTGLGDQSKPRGCGLPLPCHSCAESRRACTKAIRQFQYVTGKRPAGIDEEKAVGSDIGVVPSSMASRKYWCDGVRICGSRG
ncbi:MAG: hypothetical protein LBE86_09700 [Gemmobacter sp.]|nr:hypothetical protein [Gemmobacter sp.]